MTDTDTHVWVLTTHGDGFDESLVVAVLSDDSEHALEALWNEVARADGVPVEELDYESYDLTLEDDIATVDLDSLSFTLTRHLVE